MAIMDNRIIVLIDMDCFFCQVEARLHPEYIGKPLAVVQYNKWRSGGIIAVNYEARNYGVTRHMRSEEAKEKCPEIILASVPCLRGKADISRYRSAGREIIEVLTKNCTIVEKASVDEAYLDISQMVDDKLSKEKILWNDILNKLGTTFIVGQEEIISNNEEIRKKGIETWFLGLYKDVQIQRLAIAGLIIEDLRKEIFENTKFKCSAGISLNKTLAKLACGLHKPNKQTILPQSSITELFKSLPIKKVKHLGGKLGDLVIDSLKCNVIGELSSFSKQFLQNNFDEKTGLWLYNIARGIDNEPVTSRTIEKSIGACKRFPGKQNITSSETLKQWLENLAVEVCDRLQQDLGENHRKATSLSISFQYIVNKVIESHTRSVACTSYNQKKIVEQSLKIILKEVQKLRITFLGISANKFVSIKESANLKNFLKQNKGHNSFAKINEEPSKSLESDNVLNAVEIVINKDFIDDRKFFTDTNKIKPKKTYELIFSAVEEKNPTKISSNNKIKKILKQDDFKNSYFMNIFREKLINISTHVSKNEETILN